MACRTDLAVDMSDAASAVDVDADVAVALLVALGAVGTGAAVDSVAARTPDDAFVAYYRSVHTDGIMVQPWSSHFYCCRVCRISCACSSPY